jgi:hypothetical protein
VIAIFAVAVAGIVVPSAAIAAPASQAEAVAAAPVAPAANAGDFDPGNIVSDDNFFNGGAMTPDQVQSFLNGQVSACRAGYTCLKDYRQSTPTLAASLRCGPYQGGPNERASDIIAKVGAACGISQRALLVLLQKEQSLVTDTWPLVSQYNHATGYGCPDTAPCDPNVAGFFYQVYWGAYAFQAYRANGGGNYKAGQTNTIQWNPNGACGSSQVYIQNLATAGLYTYTPYRPNAAALANLYGTGDGCSSYGNRNFWRLWSDWFGSPTAPASNVTGAYETATATLGADSATILLAGWAFDRADPTGSTHVHLYVTAPGFAQSVIGVWATGSRPDVGTANPQAGPNHGWSYTLAAPTGGTYTVCAYGIAKSGPAASLGCRSISVGAESPVGSFDFLRVDSVTGTSITLAAGGWTYQPNMPSETGRVNVQVTYPDGHTVTTKVTANVPRPDVQTAYSLPDPNHGWSFALPTTQPGAYQVCVSSVGIGWQNAGQKPLLGCKTATVPGAGGVVGALTSAAIKQTTTDATLTATGWALDPTWPTLSSQVHVYSGATGGAQTVQPMTASLASPEAAAAVPAGGTLHGFSFTRPITAAGNYSVCAYGIGLGPFNGGKNPKVGCATLSASARAPIGSLDSVVRTADGIQVSGWSLDRDVLKTSTMVHLYVTAPDGTTSVQGVWATTPRADISVVYPGAGPNHAFSVSLPATQRGSYTVCAYGIGIAFLNRGANSSFGCKSVSNAQQAPIGSFDAAARVEGGIWVAGWTLQQNLPTTSTMVHAYVTAPDGTTTVQGLWATNPRSDIAAAFGDAGPNHGFGATIPVTQSGTYTICLYAIGAGPWNQGANASLGCRLVSTAAQAPIGSYDVATRVDGGIWVGGWTLQRDVPTTSTNVHAYVTAPDGTTTVQLLSAAAARPDIAAAFAGAGPNHGFGGVIPATQSGTYQVCVYAIAVGWWNAGANPLLGCRPVSVGIQSPVGSFDAAVKTDGGIWVAGWTYQPNAPKTPTDVRIDVTAPDATTSSTSVTASNARADVAAAFPGIGTSHGFGSVIAATQAGTYRVCATALGAGQWNAGATASLGCKTVVI